MNTISTMPATGYEQITVSNSAIGLTASKFHSAQRAMIQVTAQPVNALWDGTTPTASVGINYVAGETLILEGQRNMAQFLAIRSSGSDSTLHVIYEGLA